MTIPRIMVIQPDQTAVTLHYNNGNYRQSVTALTIFNPSCLALDPKEVVSYEQIAPYARSRNVTWLLVGLSLGLLTNVYGSTALWTYGLVVMTFAVATVIFSSHQHAKQMLYQFTLHDDRRIIGAIDSEYINEMQRQFKAAKEKRPDGLYSDHLNEEESRRSEKIRYGIVTATSGAALFKITQTLFENENLLEDFGTALCLGLIPILIGLIIVSTTKMLRVDKRPEIINKSTE